MASTTPILEFDASLDQDVVYPYTYPHEAQILQTITPPKELPFSFAYGLTTSHVLDSKYLEHVSPFLGQPNPDVLKHTLMATTQLADPPHYTPLRRYLRSRFPFLNRHRLQETVSTDPIFANTQDVNGRTCAQVFYGTCSRFINVYGMRSKGEFPLIYKDFLREEGIPSVLMRDNVKEEKSPAIQELNRTYLVKDRFCGPENPWQNHVEGHAIRVLKARVATLLARTGAPSIVWCDALHYLADLHNITSRDDLRWRTPYERRCFRCLHTPDISAYLQYQSYEKTASLSLNHALSNVFYALPRPIPTSLPPALEHPPPVPPVPPSPNQGESPMAAPFAVAHQGEVSCSICQSRQMGLGPDVYLLSPISKI
eukprot:Nitzschia sp. Nitz4//scaffold619_size2308//700//2068//NITZ4_009297-RA/size2308-processed-gene-0.3-mRNA-1//1//CDS//3329555649//4960//frame0